MNTHDLYYNILNKSDHFVEVLRKYSEYSNEVPQWTKLDGYHAYTSNSMLCKLVDLYNLKRMVCASDAQTCINITRWVYERLYYKEVGNYTGIYSATAILEYSTKNRLSVNCAMHAIVLMEMLLGVGIPSRCVQCLPLDSADNDSHVMVWAYLKDIDKALALDPSFSVYFTLDDGTFCDFSQLRSCYVDKVSFKIHRNTRFKKYQNFNEEWYRTYLCKNLFRFAMITKPAFTYKDGEIPSIYYLNPIGFSFKQIAYYDHLVEYHTDNIEFFWKA